MQVAELHDAVAVEGRRKVGRREVRVADLQEGWAETQPCSHDTEQKERRGRTHHRAYLFGTGEKQADAFPYQIHDKEQHLGQRNEHVETKENDHLGHVLRRMVFRPSQYEGGNQQQCVGQEKEKIGPKRVPASVHELEVQVDIGQYQRQQ